MIFEPNNALLERPRARWLDTTHRDAASKLTHRGLVRPHSKSTRGAIQESTCQLLLWRQEFINLIEAA